VSQKFRPSNNAEVIGEVLELRKREGAGSDYSRATTAPNMMLNDSDVIGIFAYVDELKFEREKLTISTDYVRFFLERRTPALPRWLQEGIISVYHDVLFTERPITLRPLFWRSRAETQSLIKDPNAPRTLLAVGDLFSNHSTAPTGLVLAQCGLLVRWALDPQNGVRDAFWKFAARASEEPLTEEMFQSCFGFGFADLRDRLSDYLPAAVKSPLQLPLDKSPARPALEIRRATPAEVARLRGEWERLSVPLVRQRHPEHAGRYVEQARRTVQRAYEGGDRDPRLLATLGLGEIDAGNDAAAREFLEQAAVGRVVRPRAYLELARLRWSELTRGQPPSREFDADQLAPVLEPLRLGYAQNPPLAEAVGLWADVRLRASVAPPDEEVKALLRGARLFITDARLCFRVARALGRHGRSAEAVALLGEGFLHVRDDATRAQFAQMYAVLTKPRRAE
jgi:hypothetical protein